MTHITIENRVAAAVEATYIEGKLEAQVTSGQLNLAVWEICFCCKQKNVDLSRVRAALDQLIILQARDYFQTAFLRLRCARIEAALGLAHDPLTKPALVAWSAEGRSWESYCDSFKPAEAA